VPNHTWSYNNTQYLRHVTETDKQNRASRTLHPWPTTTDKIIKALIEQPNLNVTGIREKTGFSSRTVDKALKKLAADGVVNPQWDGKNKRHILDRSEARVFQRKQLLDMPYF
jgi:hypothetical protein